MCAVKVNSSLTMYVKVSFCPALSKKSRFVWCCSGGILLPQVCCQINFEFHNEQKGVSLHCVAHKKFFHVLLFRNHSSLPPCMHLGCIPILHVSMGVVMACLLFPAICMHTEELHGIILPAPDLSENPQGWGIPPMRPARASVWKERS